MDSNKENQEQEEAPLDLPSVASPRISSVGASEDAAASSRPTEHEAQAYELTSGHDHLHWGGVGRRVGQQPHDARSIASSAATRDDKSIFEEPGALDATEEGEEHDGVAEEEEEPVEITLTQVHDELPDGALRTECSNVESTFTAISAGGSLAEVVDQLADQAVAGELSPRQAAAAIRSATETTSPGSVRVGNSAFGPPLESSDSISMSGAAQSSVALSEDNWQGGSGGGGPSDALETVALETVALETVALEADAPAQMELATQGPAAAADGPAAGQAGAAGAAEGGHRGGDELVLEGEAGAAAPSGEQSEQPPAALEEAPAPEEPAAAAPAVPALDESLREGAAGGTAADEPGTPVAANGTAAAAAPVPAAPPYQSHFMQQLAGSTSEDDLTVYTTDAQGVPHEAVRAASPDQQPQAPQQAGSAPPAAAARQGGAMQPLSIDSSGDRSTAEASAALAAINNVGGRAGEGSEGQAPPQPGLPFPQSWYQTFNGLLYMDGVDALGRPVVVLDADAVPPNMKSSALVFVKAHLEPLVNQGDYVLVLTSRGTAKLPSMWVMGAYRSLPRPFRKNVQYIVLVRPSAFLRAVLAFMRPFVSKKAGRKIKQVQSVHEIADATGGEVTLQSLGQAFAASQLATGGVEGGNSGDASP